MLGPDDVAEIGEHPQRADDDQLTVYKSVGVAAQDAAAASWSPAAQARASAYASASDRRRLSGVRADQLEDGVDVGAVAAQPVVAGSTRRAATRQSSTPSPRIVVTALSSGVNVHGSPSSPTSSNATGPDNLRPAHENGRGACATPAAAAPAGVAHAPVHVLACRSKVIRARGVRARRARREHRGRSPPTKAR